MKYSNAAIISFIICIVGCVVALRYIEPIEFVTRDKYGLTLEQLKPKCDMKDKRLYTEITADQEKSSRVRAELTRILLKKAKNKKGKVTENDWDKWIKEICIPNKTLKRISISAIEKIQKCLNKKEQLNRGEKLKAQKELFKNFCNKVQLEAEFQYQGSKLENP